MRIIVLEGIDGAGKTIQAKMMLEALRGQGNKCLGLSFPDYTSFIGRQIGGLLGGNLNIDAQSIDPHSMALWFATERLQCFRNLNPSLYDYIILNRYTTSNAVYQSLRLPLSQRRAFVRWVLELEHEEFALPKAHTTFVLDIDENLSTHNVAKKGFRCYCGYSPDVYENTSTLASARGIYRTIAEDEPSSFKIVDCMLSGLHSMRPAQDIHREIMDVVSRPFCGTLIK